MSYDGGELVGTGTHPSKGAHFTNRKGRGCGPAGQLAGCPC